MKAESSLALKYNFYSVAPSYNTLLYRSNYENYNWDNEFDNSVTNSISLKLTLRNILDLDIDLISVKKHVQFEKLIDDNSPGINNYSIIPVQYLDNLEVLKIAKQNEIIRLSSVINDDSNTDMYKNLGVEVVEPDILLARRFEHILEPRRVVSQAFAGGRAEAIEIEISSDSPVRGKKLREIGSDYYIVGALLRKVRL